MVSLELAQRRGSVAAKLGDGEIVELETVQGDRDRDSVMPSLDQVTSLVGGSPKNVDSVIVSVGPGGFTGLRVAVATAKMISLATGASIVPVETAIGVVGADQHAPKKSLVVSAIKNSTFWLSIVDQGLGTCKSSLVEHEALEQQLFEGGVLYGDSLMSDEIRRICEAHSVEIRTTPSSASSIMIAGLALLAQGKTVAPNALVPLYPREPEAVRNWKLRHPQ